MPDSAVFFAEQAWSLVKSEYQKNIFLISQPKHMLWVLKRTVNDDGSFEYLKHMFKLMVKKIFTMLRDSYAKKNCLSKPMKAELFLTKPQDMLCVMCMSWYIFVLQI